VQEIRQLEPGDLLIIQPIKPNFSRIITPMSASSLLRARHKARRDLQWILRD
jgi:hypothetical protein